MQKFCIRRSFLHGVPDEHQQALIGVGVEVDEGEIAQAVDPRALHSPGSGAYVTRHSVVEALTHAKRFAAAAFFAGAFGPVFFLPEGSYEVI